MPEVGRAKRPDVLAEDQCRAADQRRLSRAYSVDLGARGHARRIQTEHEQRLDLGHTQSVSGSACLRAGEFSSGGVGALGHGTPRNVPIGFTWNGSEIVMCTAKNAPKLPALRKNPTVALTIDTEVHPPKILLIRGRAELDVVDGIVPICGASECAESWKSARKCRGGMSRNRTRLRPRSEHGHNGPTA